MHAQPRHGPGRDFEGQRGGHIVQRQCQRGAHGSGVGDNRHRAAVAGLSDHGLEGRTLARHDVGKAFPAWRTVCGQVNGRHHAKVRDLGKGQPVMIAEILLPQTIIQIRRPVRPERQRRLNTPQGRADNHRANAGGETLQRHPDRRITKHRGHVRSAAKAPAMVCGRMSNQEQFRGVGRHHFGAFQPDRNMLCHDRMGKSILITGGARSGKSTLAERMTLELGRPAIYVATAEAHDTEMEKRIALHQARRGPEWQTLQAPRDLVGALEQTDGAPRLVDCLTLWLTNLMLAGEDWQAQVEALALALPRQSAPVVFVTNEVGAGIVPENALARAFRDAAGLVNQRIATACDELWFCVAGHPLKVKPA